MKKIYFLLLFPVFALAQSTNQNYVKNTIYKVPTLDGTNINLSGGGTVTDDDKKITIVYYEGLGKPIQQVAHKQSGSGKDIITHVEYDMVGRQPLEYLPYVRSNPSQDFDSSGKTNTEVFYATNNQSLTGNLYFETTTNPRSEKLFEPSPLSRVLKQAAHGNTWVMGSGHELKMDYQTNTASEVRFLKALSQWDPVNEIYSISISNSSYYIAEQLHKTITYDENSAAIPTESTGSSIEFTNKLGQVVLKRTYDAGIAHDTYYVYDQFGNLTYVLPPLAEVGTAAITQQTLDGLCYQYKYDSRNRMVEKKLPGKDSEFIVYDKLDRVVATGPAYAPYAASIDPVGWIITKYDALNRVIYTGWQPGAANAAARKSKQAIHNAAASYAINEIKTSSGTIDGKTVYYTNFYYPTSFKLLTVNYYDTYNFPNGSLVPNFVENQVVGNAKGLLTGQWIKVYGLNNSMKGNVHNYYYDTKGRQIGKYTTLYITGGYRTSNTKLDFAGRPLSNYTVNRLGTGNTAFSYTEYFNYTGQDRLLSHTMKIGSPIQLLALNSYDELGQLISKKAGGPSNGSGILQKVDYRYNIRGWLTNINDVDGLLVGTDPFDLFAFKINYNTPENTMINAAPLYNGNISETYWRTGNDDIKRMYGYSYDNLNRLTDAHFKKNPDSNGLDLDIYHEDVAYDKNGNITDLHRNGWNEPDAEVMEIDNLKYSYNALKPNQLDKVHDFSDRPEGFKDNDSQDPGDNYIDYHYDGLGNMTYDQEKLKEITYNHLNLPMKVASPNGDNIAFYYDSEGRKVQKVVTKGSTVTTTDYVEGGIQYTNNVLDFFATSEGYVKNTVINGVNNYNYVFHHKDHLGNVRLSYTKGVSGNATKILEENNYYPFGLKQEGYNPDRYDFTVVSNVLALAINGGKTYNYNYLGQEQQTDLDINWNSFKWRNYDAAIGRFIGIDPITTKYMSISPYQFAHNNPVWKIELEGLEGQNTNQTTDEINEEMIEVESYSEKGEDGVIRTITISVSTNLRDRWTGERVDTPSSTLEGENNSDGCVDLTYTPLFPPMTELMNGPIPVTDEMLIANDMKELAELAAAIPGIAGAGKKLLQETLEKVAKNGPDSIKDLQRILKSGKESISGLDKQILEHEKKLADYIKDPIAGDNKGFLKNVGPELQQKIINTRIESLQKQISTFKQDRDAIGKAIEEILKSF